jgi:predicted GNAT family acetyltransferase
MPGTNAATVSDNAARSRYELVEHGLTAFADYARREGRLLIRHVEAPVPLRGTGAAGRLMEGVIADARARGIKVAPLCGYAAAWLRRHPEHADMVD